MALGGEQMGLAHWPHRRRARDARQAVRGPESRQLRVPARRPAGVRGNVVGTPSRYPLEVERVAGLAEDRVGKVELGDPVAAAARAERAPHVASDSSR